MEVIKYRFYLLLFANIVFAQPNFKQVEINISTTMDIAYAGKIFLKTTQLVSDGLYKEEVQSEYEKFYVRIFAGGNKTVGKVINNSKQALIMYDKTKKKYTEELFKDIRENNGIPLLKDVTKMEPGGNNNRSNSSDSSRYEDRNNINREIARSISNDFININGFDCQKITTNISDTNGTVQIEEWVTSDTSLFMFVESELISLINSYGGTYSKPRDSSNWIKAIDSNKKIDTIAGEIIKSSIVWKNNEGENSFSMSREVLSAAEVNYNFKEFEISKKFKKVPELD